MSDDQYIIFFLIFLVITREAFQQADWKTHNPAYSDIWHALGWLLRFMIFGMLYRTGAGWVMLSAAVALMWAVYNILINIGRGNKWYYLSNRGIDKILRKIFFWVKF